MREEERRSAPSGPEAATRWRIRLLATATALVGLAFAQDPGLLVADTKFDLATDPGFFLERALHLWDPASAFGQLQNQAYGYLWPMGPLFWLGDLLGIPGWAVQRLWLALVMVVAFLGTARLARALGVRSDLACVLAGVAYALSPRALSIMGSISIEQWPSALAPWVLLPLVRGSTTGSARRAALLSAVAVALVGGVNAAATFAVLPLGVVWLLTRSPGPRRRALMLWWPAFTVLGTLWWLVPLFVLGAYSPPFLDFIESAANTTFSTDVFNAMRGTSNWVPYVDDASRAGNDLIRTPTLVITGAAVMLFGVVGLLDRRNPHRLFLGCSLLLGLVLVNLGHQGGVGGWFAGDLRTLLDGALAPLRNVHKFDLVVRLPLVLGLAWAVDSWVRSLRRERPAARADDAGRTTPDWVGRLNDGVLVGTAVVAVLASALPAFSGRITPVGATSGVPEYWAEAAAWFDDRPGTTLLLPGSSFGDYVWGSPHDEPFQSLARSPWAVRNAIPLAPPGNIRMLDAVERRVAQGEGSPGLAPFLRRAGVRYLLVRNDLVRTGGMPDPVLVHQALAASPDIVRVAGFGVDVGGEAHLETADGGRILVNSGWQNQYRALEVYEVGGPWSPAQTAPDLPVVVGGPEDLLDLADLGVVDDGPVQLATDLDEPPAPDTPLVLTDGLRRVERHFGRLHDGASATLAPGDPLALDKPVLDYGLGSERWETVAATEGGRVSASSSMSEADAFGTIVPGQLPTAAVDGEESTYWRSSFDTARAAWWQVDLPEPREVTEVRVTAAYQRERVRVRVDGQLSDPVVVEAGRSRTITLGGGPTSSVRVEDALELPGHQLALAEVEVPGLEVTRSLVVPSLPDGWRAPDVVALRAVTDARTGCAEVDGAVRCVLDREIGSEEPLGFRRQVTLPGSATFDEVRMTARARPDGVVPYLLQDQPIGISASTTGNPDPQGSALAAIDGDTGTTWTAGEADVRPELRLSWLGRQQISGLQLSVADDTAARLPERLELRFGDGTTAEVDVDADGTVSFPPVRTDGLTIRVLEAEAATSLDFASRALPVPVGITELDVTGLPYTPVTLSGDRLPRACGSGPTLVVDGRRIATTVLASPAAVYSGDPVRVEPCDDDPVELGPGTTDIAVEPSDGLAPLSVVLGDAGTGSEVAGDATPAAGSGPAPDTETFEPTSDGVLATFANVNGGWVARQDGGDLTAVTVDGWRQGWRLEDDGAVTARYEPDGTYRAGLAVGAVLLAMLLGLLLWPRRRWPGHETPALRPARAPWPLVAGIGVVAGGVLAGWVGATAAALTLGVAAAVGRRAPEARPPVMVAWAAVAFAPAVVAFAVRPWADPAGWAGSLAWPAYLLVAVAVSPLGLLLQRRQGGSMSRKRAEGSSTSR